MEMTHYMELLASNQPWNLILFMAIPVVLAETVAICELYLLYTGKRKGSISLLSKLAGILGGIYFIGVFFYLLFTAVIPLTHTGAWRGIIDMIAVGFYLLGVFPLVGIALVDMNILPQFKDEKKSAKYHAIFVGIFLVFAHIAMIFGMLAPNTAGEMSEMTHKNMTENSSSNQEDELFRSHCAMMPEMSGCEKYMQISNSGMQHNSMMTGGMENMKNPMNMSMEDMGKMLEGKTGDALDKAFLEGMIPHHQGAIDMAKYLEQSARPELQELGKNIITAQQAEIEQMQNWLKEWNLE